MGQLQPEIKIIDNLCLTQKPTGLPTHRADEGNIGFCEWLESVLDRKLYVCHRLDKETSGALVFALNGEKAQELTELFTHSEVSKRYLFITDKQISDSLQNSVQIIHKSYIEKKANAFVSQPTASPNSETTFRLIKQDQKFSLFEALPKTGKPHQIRLHAQDLGIAILGDYEHGGTHFPTLCLHAHEIKTPQFTHSSPPPIYFENLSLLSDNFTVSILKSIQRRKHLYNFNSYLNESLRLLHDETPECSIDLLGHCLWVNWFNETPPTEKHLSAIDFATKTLNLTNWFVRERPLKKKAPLEWKTPNFPEIWEGHENSVKYQFRSHCGQAPGLFLDQRNNRLWVRQNSNQKKVLNLFSYTGGFSLNAALGGAAEVCTVDLNSQFIDWTKENFKLNNLDPSKYEFWSADTFRYIDGAIKRNKNFDIIICDPPSFSRKEKTVFQIEKDLDDLILRLSKLLTKNGQILFCTNYEKWNLLEFQKRVSKIAQNLNLNFKNPPLMGLDFEINSKSPIMKSAFLTKKS